MASQDFGGIEENHDSEDTAFYTGTYTIVAGGSVCYGGGGHAPPDAGV
jgi:hypothetical protein